MPSNTPSLVRDFEGPAELDRLFRCRLLPGQHPQDPHERALARLEYDAAMGVTAYFFAFDPRVYTAPPTIDRLREAGELDDELNVAGKATMRLKEISSRLGDNKRWSDNLAGDWAWTCARKHVEPKFRAELDAWFSHLFWHVEGETCPCGRAPITIAESEEVYDHSLIGHILSLERPLEPVQPWLAHEFDGDPPRQERFDRPWVYDFGGFCELVLEHQHVFERTRAAGPGWSLLRWVWY